LATHKKLKCEDCGEYNDTGHAQPFTEAAREVKAEAKAEKAATFEAFRSAPTHAEKVAVLTAGRGGPPPSMHDAWATGRANAKAKAEAKQAKRADKHGTEPTSVEAPVVTSPPVTSVADELKKLADLRDAGVLTEEEFAGQKAVLLANDKPTSASEAPTAFAG
jgi:hypothetical protein